MNSGGSTRSRPLGDMVDDVDARVVDPETRPLRILVWCNYDPTNAAMVCDHINAFVKYSGNAVYTLSRVGSIPDDLDLREFDVIIIHYSLTLALDSYVSHATRLRLRDYPGLKAIFVQDEYRFVRRTTEMMRFIGVDLIFTCIPEQEIHKVYPPEEFKNVTIRNVLTGAVSTWLTTYVTVPLAKRPIEVGYRGRTMPLWHGEFGREKWEIGRRVLEDAKKYNLRVNIAWSERSRLYGRAWIEFMQNCRAVLAAESGVDILDVDGELGATAEQYEQLLDKDRGANPRVRERLYQAVQKKFIGEKHGMIDMAQVSPRVFEAAALRTLLILYEGRYSDVVTPWRHFVPLRKDHSNMAEVVRFLRDDEAVSEMIARTYAEVALNPRFSYGTHIAFVDEELRKAARGRYRAFATRLSPSQFSTKYGFYFIDNPHAYGRPWYPNFWVRYASLGKEWARHATKRVLKRA